MSSFGRFALAIGVVAILAGCAGPEPAGVPSALPDGTGSALVPQWQAEGLATTSCPQVIGAPTCLALQVVRHGVTPLCAPASCGWTASQLQAAYNISRWLGQGTGTNVAVVEEGDLPNAAADLWAYRKAFGLGKVRFAKYNERGQKSNYPPSCQTYGWCLESDLDIEMVSAACPKCNIFLMEAKNGTSNFERSEAEAVTLGATIVSNSWICYGSGDCGDPNFSSYFDTPGIAYVAAAGDAGYDNVGAPSALADVIAVGGTQLALRGSRYSESVWGAAGGGCAGPSHVGGAGIPKPPWQKDKVCGYRTVGDLSLESGCAPGVAVYGGTYGGWIGVCGTSVGSPFTAGVIALAGNAANLDAGKTFWTASTFGHKNFFHHPSGSDGNCGNYLCGDGRYRTYYSGPGGWGTPNGIKGY